MWVTVAGEVNETLHVAPYTDFYNDAINDALDLQEDFKRWYYRNYTEEGRASAGAEMFFSFCDCPFVLDAAAKSKILQYDAIVQQREQFDVRDQVTPAFVLLVFWGVFGAGSDVPGRWFFGGMCWWGAVTASGPALYHGALTNIAVSGVAHSPRTPARRRALSGTRRPACHSALPATCFSPRVRCVY